MTKLYFLLMILVSPALLWGQQDLEESTFLKAQELRQQLGLTLQKSLRTEDILNVYNQKLKKTIRQGSESDESFESRYAIIKKERDFALSKIFDSQQMTLFTMIENGEITDIKEFYSSLFVTLADNAAFLEELSIYKTQQTPVLLKYKGRLNAKISQPDSLELVGLGTRFNHLLEIALEQTKTENRTFSDTKLKKMVKSTSEVDPKNKDLWKRIKKLSKKYRGAIDIEFAELDKYTAEWNQGMKAILLRHLPYEQTKDLNQMFFVLTQYGISKKLDKYAFLLFNEADISTYFDLKGNIQEIFMKNSL